MCLSASRAFALSLMLTQICAARDHPRCAAGFNIRISNALAHAIADAERLRHCDGVAQSECESDSLADNYAVALRVGLLVSFGNG